MTPDLEHSPESKLHPEPVPEEVMSRSSDPPSPKNDQELLRLEYQ